VLGGKATGMTRSRGAVEPVGLVCLQRTGGGLRRRAEEDWPEEPTILIVESVGAGPEKSGLIVDSWTLLRIATEAGQRRLARRTGCNDLGERQRRCVRGERPERE
jgi:hypothetical protein